MTVKEQQASTSPTLNGKEFDQVQHEEPPLGRPKNQSRHHADMNRAMIELVPELDSKWASTPMAFDRWRRPDEVIDNGDPCFIPRDPSGNDGKDMPRKQDYIFMKQRKDLEAGYYHLRTQEAYVEVYHRLCKNAPPLFPCCTTSENSPDVSRKEYRKVKQLIYNRVLAKEPNDVLAAQMRLVNVTSKGGQAAQWGKAMYLPTVTSSILLGLAGGQ